MVIKIASSVPGHLLSPAICMGSSCLPPLRFALLPLAVSRARIGCACIGRARRHFAFCMQHSQGRTHTHTQATVAVAAAYYGARILQLQLPSSSSSSSPSSSLLSLCCEVRLKWALLGCTDCNAAAAAAAAAVAVAVASSVVQIATIACAPSLHRCDQQHSHSQLD